MLLNVTKVTYLIKLPFLLLKWNFHINNKWIYKDILRFYSLLLTLSLTLFSHELIAKDKFKIIGCYAEPSLLCSSIEKQKEYALSLAQTDTPSALANTESAKLDYIIQSDDIDSVVHFKFKVYKDYELVTAENGGEVYQLVYRQQLIKQTELSGDVREEVLDKVSRRRILENLRSNLNLPIRSNYTLDFDTTCGSIENTSLKTRRPELMAASCLKYLKHDTKVFANSWNGILDFTTEDGYWMTVKPNNNEIDITYFMAPPNIQIPVNTDGTIITEGLEDRLFSGLYTYNHTNRKFISTLASRMKNSRFAELSKQLSKGVECKACTRKTVDKLNSQNNND